MRSQMCANLGPSRSELAERFIISLNSGHHGRFYLSCRTTQWSAKPAGSPWFFPTSIPVDVAIAGLRLVLAGGVYRPLPIIRQNEASEISGSTALPVIHVGNDATEIIPE